MKNTILQRSAAGAIALAALPGLTSAADIRVEFEAVGPVAFAPLFSGFHDGSFSTFQRGETASAALESLAEGGDPAMLIGSLPESANGGAVVGGPVIPVGTSANAIFDVAESNSWFSYASMLLPTNDWYIGNSAAIDISEVVNGGHGASMTMTIPADRVYDAGTESEDFAFSAGNPLFPGLPTPGTPGGSSTSEGIALVPIDDNPFGSFANADGFDVSTLDFSGGDVARITITNVSGLNGAGAAFPDAVTLGDEGFAYADEIGIFYSGSYPWIWKSNLGWLYVSPADDGYFFYQQNTGQWAWSDAGVWPFYYDFGTGDFAEATE